MQPYFSHNSLPLENDDDFVTAITNISHFAMTLASDICT